MSLLSQAFISGVYTRQHKMSDLTVSWTLTHTDSQQRTSRVRREQKFNHTADFT